MPRQTDIRIVEATCWFEPIHFRAPLKFGGRVVDHSYCMNVRVTAETAKGDRADGFGSMPVGNVWAWPTSKLEGDQTEAAMKLFAERVTESATQAEPGHPIEIMHELHDNYAQLARTIAAESHQAN